MTLHELRAASPALFHPNQDWFVGERFADQHPDDYFPAPRRRVPLDLTDALALARLPSAVELATAYVTSPHHPIWRDYLWTRDLDQHLQRVYVGGVVNGHGFEIHRHIHLTPRFGAPSWEQL